MATVHFLTSNGAALSFDEPFPDGIKDQIERGELRAIEDPENPAESERDQKLGKPEDRKPHSSSKARTAKKD